MKVLVTGATGFIGSNLIERLVSHKWEVKALVRPKNRRFNINNKVEMIFGDLKDLDKVKNKIKKTDIVFNLAGALPHHYLPEKKYWETNVEGVKNLLKVYRNSNIKRFVHVSTTGIYGSTIWANERSALHLDSVYAKSKAVGENFVFEAYKKEKLPVTIIKPTIAYGPGDTRPGFSNLFPLIKKMIFVPVGEGKNFFHTIYVENLVEALILAATNKEAIGEDFIIGDDPCPTMKQIIKTIARVENVTIWPFYIPLPLAFMIGKCFDVTKKFGIPSILNSQRVKFITENKKFDISKAKKILGYKASVNLEEGIRKTYLWYKENNYL